MDIKAKKFDFRREPVIAGGIGLLLSPFIFGGDSWTLLTGAAVGAGCFGSTLIGKIISDEVSIENSEKLYINPIISGLAAAALLYPVLDGNFLKSFATGHIAAFGAEYFQTRKLI